MARLKCFPLVWDPVSGGIAVLQKRAQIILIRGIEVLQLVYFGAMVCTIISQAKVGCTLILLPSIRMLLATLLVYLWGMGVGLAKKAAVLLNTTIKFEQWLQDTFKTMDILTSKGDVRYINMYISFAYLFIR